MKKDRNRIVICRVTRRNMQFSFLWPKFEEEMNPGKWYYFKAYTFFITYAVFPLSTFIHLMMTLYKHLDLFITEDMAVIASSTGITYMAAVYIKKQKHIAILLYDLSQFKNFGKPKNFEALNKKLNIWSWIAFLYPTVGTLIYNILKLLQKPNCEQENQEKNLDEKCGLMYPIWMPFGINYFPVFHILFFYVCLSSILFFRVHLSIFFHALEIAQHVILRIEHLSNMIQEAFNSEDFYTFQRKIKRCIQYHQKILDMSSRLDNAFSGLMFVHFLMTATICGCLEKQFIDGTYPMNAIVHLSGWILSLFIASFGGQKLIDASESLSNKIYEAKWYRQDYRFQKNVHFMLLASQKKLGITVGPLGNLSYSFFLSVMKMSYSVLTMLTS